MATSLSTRCPASNPYTRPSLPCPSSSSSFHSCFRPLPFGGRGRNQYSSRRSSAGLVRASFEQFDNVEMAASAISQAFPNLLARAEGLLYTLADAAVSTDAAPAAADTVQKQSRDWLSGLTDVLESFLKVLKAGFEALHVPYSYGFAIILLTIIVKAATFPLTKQQVESTLAMQNLSPKIKAIQQRYAGDQERIQLETARLYKQAGVNPLAGCFPTLATIPVWIGLYRALSNVANEGLLTEGFFWIPSLAGPTTIAARQSGSGISWLFPFVDGHPPLGWSDTAAYLVLPVLLIVSQLTNNILSTTQQIWLRKLGGAKPPVNKEGGDIISAGQALRSTSAPVIDTKEQRRGERFRQLKMEEARKKAEQAEAAKRAAEAAKAAENSPAESDDEDGSDEEGQGGETVDLTSAKDSLEEIYNRNGAAGQDSSTSRRGKRSKRKRAA